jgi:transcriptional regulator with XRE-family HTH domain
MPNELGRRIKAARGYAGLSQPALAAALEIGEQTEKRIELGQRPAKRSELLAIAEACNVPMWFLESGWNGWQDASAVDRLGERALIDVETSGLPRQAGKRERQ